MLDNRWLFYLFLAVTLGMCAVLGVLLLLLDKEQVQPIAGACAIGYIFFLYGIALFDELVLRKDNGSKK